MFKYQSNFGGFANLMPNRVHRILLVSSPYDSAAIAQDDQFSEMIYSQYFDLSLGWAPQLTRVSSGEEAIKLMQEERFDLIITVMRIKDMPIMDFAREVKKQWPAIPIVVLVFNIIDTEKITAEDHELIDHVFLWGGDAQIFVAIIKSIEDKLNIDNDIKVADVQAILLVEDSVGFYSAYLPLIYSEIVKQTQSLIGDGVNMSHKLLRGRARPKILLATNYNEAEELYNKYKNNILGVISDVRFQIDGKIDPQAGIKLAKEVKADRSDTPVLLQSSEPANAYIAESINASFLNKNSQTMLSDLRAFISGNLGFGDFVFYNPETQTKIDSAWDLHSIIEALKRVPDESIEYHAKNNHFSKWLMARTEFELAYKVRDIKASDFNNVTEIRNYLIDSIESFLSSTEQGIVVDFRPQYFNSNTPFAKIGNGSLGGKARGLSYLNAFFKQNNVAQSAKANINIPQTVVVATDIFNQFMEKNNLYTFLATLPSDEAIRNVFLNSDFPENVKNSLRQYIEKVSYPIVVRSSSVMEDSQTQPFAGIYDTYLLGNSHNDSNVRFDSLCRAVKLVYASTFYEHARNYRGSTSRLHDEEKMAVILQRLIGNKHDDRFYPDIAGVAQSHNFYSMPPVMPSDGSVHCVLGLGSMVVEGNNVLRFSPNHPKSLYQFATLKDYSLYSQKYFLALNLNAHDVVPGEGPRGNLVKLSLDIAQADGTLQYVASTYDRDNDRMYEGTGQQGPKFITFAPILQSEIFPLADSVKTLLDIGKEAVGSDVEIEFAADIKTNTFYVLQMRPMSVLNAQSKIDISDVDRGKIIVKSTKTLGHGIFNGIKDIVYVKPESFDSSKTKLMAATVGELNKKFFGENKKYLLIGAGRWGSSDHWLGIPVSWGQITNAGVIAETTLPGFLVDPSYGSHFLHNVISLGIGYFILRHTDPADILNWQWLNSNPAVFEDDYIRHISLAQELDIRISSQETTGIAAVK